MKSGEHWEGILSKFQYMAKLIILTDIDALDGPAVGESDGCLFGKVDGFLLGETVGYKESSTTGKIIHTSM